MVFLSWFHGTLILTASSDLNYSSDDFIRNCPKAMDKPFLILILLLALVLRVGVAVGIHRYLSQSGREYLIAGDAEGYWELGRRLAAGHSYQIYTPPRQVMRMPGYPLLIAANLRLWGESKLAVRLAQAVLSTVAVGFIFLLGRDLVDPLTGRIAALVLAISPAVVGFGSLLLSETLFAVMLLFNLWLAGRWFTHRERQARNTLRAYFVPLLVGLSTALAVYVRPTWLPAVFVWVFLSFLLFPRAYAWKASLVVVAGCLITLFPWALRNHSMTGHWVWTTLWSGPSLYDSLNSEADGSSEMSFFDREQVMSRDGLSEYEMNRYYNSRARSFVRAEPGRAFELMLLHAGRYWSLTPNADQFQNVWLRYGLGSWTFLLYLFGLLGVYALRRHWLTLVLCAGPILAFGMIHTVFVGSLRYRLPAEYPFSLLVAAGILWLLGARARNPCAGPPVWGDAE